ncbi:hypothetical protein XHC_2339 [Xanthomonas hortorum pv. carotae str. M081]|nr:hypothetical protein XHC_2339 [Xanthomonas hortorum pv. carotae str. M081]
MFARFVLAAVPAMLSDGQVIVLVAALSRPGALVSCAP